MKKLFFILLTGLLVCSVFSQTELKTMHGKERIDLPPNTKLMSVNYTGSKLYYLVREMKSEENPELYLFKEHSVFGMFEFSVELAETKK